MIVFDLACAGGHVFEAWFGSSADYEEQRARGLVRCPLCESAEVGKAVMAPAVAPRSNRADPVAPRSGAPAPAEMKALLARLSDAQAKLLERSEHVGTRFADEARAIHAGDAPERAIHGQATATEARALIEDGVPVAPLPLPLAPLGTSH